MSKKVFDEYAIEHTEQILNRLMNLALNRFKWENLPQNITSRKIEEYLIKSGKVMFFKDDTFGFLALPCHNTSNYNLYNEPIEYNVIGFNYNKTVDIDKGVVIRNNALGVDDYSELETFAIRINEVELTKDINLNAQKTPYVILCDEKERLTFKNILLEIRSFKYAIFGSKRLNTQSIDVLNTNAPYLIDKLQIEKRELMNEVLTFLGINNANVDKKERLLVDEVNGNNDLIEINLNHMFEERKLACEEINKMFGLNISISKREVEFSGDLHNGVERNNI